MSDPTTHSADAPARTVAFLSALETERAAVLRAWRRPAGAGLDDVVWEVEGTRLVAAVSGPGPDRAVGTLRRLVTRYAPDIVVLAGYAGGLAPDAVPGRPIALPAGVVDDHDRRLELTDPLRCPRRVPPFQPQAPPQLLTVEKPVLSVAEKRRLHARYAAPAVDTETRPVAAAARELGVTLWLCKAVSDGGSDPVPPWVPRLVSETGAVSAWAATRSVLRRPARIVELVRLFAGARRADRRLAEMMRDVRRWIALPDTRTRVPRLADCRRLILFGGSFDPPHHAHLQLPERVRHRLEADALLYVPTAVQPLKRDRTPAPAADRLRMLDLALADRTHALILTDEIARAAGNRPSYTVETLERLLPHLHPRAELRLLIGGDQLRLFHKWKGARRILELAEPLVMVRPPDTADALLQALPTRDDRAAWAPRLVDVPPMGASSTEVRRRVAQGQPIEHLVPPAVAQYIEEAGLYRDPDPDPETTGRQPTPA